MRFGSRMMVGATVLALGVLVFGSTAGAGEIDTYGGTPPNDVRTPVDKNPCPPAGNADARANATQADVDCPSTPQQTTSNQPTPTIRETTVEPVSQTNTETPTEVETSGVVRPLAAPERSGGLPVTGGDIVGLTLIGLVAVGAGVTMVSIRRRSADS